MITRISRLINIGVFKNATNLGGIVFDKITVFYGLNTYGKTTLKDVFSSLALNDAGILTKRKSIPSLDTDKQEIKINYTEGNDPKETTVSFERNWDGSALNKKIYVFDNDFIHKNLFKGLTIERENKEAFTDFILEEKGVSLSDEIRTINQQISEKNKLNTLPRIVQNLQEYEREAFLKLSVTESKEELEKQKAEAEKNFSNLRDYDSIKKLPDLILPSNHYQEILLDLIAKLNKEISKDFSSVTSETMMRMQAHLTKCKDFEGRNLWIEQGLNAIQGEDCPFCSQSLTPAANLIETYNNYFNENYSTFVKLLNDNLEELKTHILNLKMSFYEDLNELIANLSKYSKFSNEIEASKINLINLKNLQHEINSYFETSFSKYILKAVDKKLKEPHLAGEPCALDEAFLPFFQKVDLGFSQTKVDLSEMINIGNGLKNNFIEMNEDEITHKVSNCSLIINNLAKKIDRLTHNEDCNRFLLNREAIKRLNNSLLSKNNELINQQSDYLKKYFDDLNQYFKSLGSLDFLLERRESNRGNKKVYELFIKYKNKEISNDDIHRVMSESDKRSLAFAIFLSKLKHEKNKNEFIVVLDDPVVSFDNNRIKKTTMIIKNLSNDFRQIILLTHYSSFVKNLIEDKTSLTLLEVVKNNYTSSFQKIDPRIFAQGEFERAFEKIYSFISMVHSDCIYLECRVYFENYISLRFIKEITENNISNYQLELLIKNLHEKGCFDVSTLNELNLFRETLNTPHHKFSNDNSLEDIRNLASSMINCLSKL